MTDCRSQLAASVPVGPKAPLRIPSDFLRLYDLSYNLWWSWDPVARDLWSRIDPQAWAATRNPIGLLQVVEPSTWEALAASGSFNELYDEVVERFDRYLSSDQTWFDTNHGGELEGPVAYLCAEYGINEKLPFYSGGLGVLAGDHVKSASDLGIPLIAVGLLYRRGFFRQAVDPDGWQQHTYQRLEMRRRPIREVLDPHSGRPLRVSLALNGRDVSIGAWRIDVGRVPLILLDTNLPENDPADRPITHILYVRGREARFAQETVLGIGGARVLRALEIEPSMWHVNEGHAALSLLERLSWEIDAGHDLETAKRSVADRTLFTLHTPVPAGNETFDPLLAAAALGGTIEGVDTESQRNLARSGSNDGGVFDMGALAIRLSDRTNGVSIRHADIVTRDWGELIGGPAFAVTNGVHPSTWLGRPMWRLLESALGHDWVDRVHEPAEWSAIRDIDDAKIWRAHESQRELMTRRLRTRLREEYARHGVGSRRLRWLDDQLPADRLTIGFARRFATYKRAGMLFTDPNRLEAILKNPERPVQLVFAGKAHPADREGQALIKHVFDMSHDGRYEGHLFFVEDYDLRLGRTLVTGSDVWLNTPVPPREASGTSGMKSAANGGLNLSVLDGWWVEGFDGTNGWGFGEHSSSDEEDANTLYRLLESEVVPTFYDRDEDGLPRAWIAMMKSAMITG
ncbi:MAG: alpha-glucan family phosphorylase, partial [Actinomycetota bacterium]|nr:alpha-glucan family phosphorylase [Actinomycetota bacterium]